MSGRSWEDWPALHRRQTCRPACCSFNFWLHVKMAASHTGRQEVNLTNLVGLNSDSLSLSNHLFRACGQGKRNGELCLILLRFNHSLQRVSCFAPSLWQRGGKWISTLPVFLYARPRCEWYLPSPSLSQLQLSFLLKRDRISRNLSAAARLRAQHSLGVIFFGDCNLLHHCWQQALFLLAFAAP